MSLLQERGMSKSSSGDSIFSKLVTNVRCSKTIAKIVLALNSNFHYSDSSPNTCVFGLSLTITFLYFVDPLRDSFIGECDVLRFPSFIIKRWIRMIISVLSVFPHWVLEKSTHAPSFGGVIYPAKIIQTKDKIPRIRKTVHYKKSIVEKAPNIRKIQ